jgi:hypothetical protein
VGFGRVSLPEIGFGVSRGRVWHLEGAARNPHFEDANITFQLCSHLFWQALEGQKQTFFSTRAGKAKTLSPCQKTGIGKKKNPKNTAAEVGTKLKIYLPLSQRMDLVSRVSALIMASLQPVSESESIRGSSHIAYRISLIAYRISRTSLGPNPDQP